MNSTVIDEFAAAIESGRRELEQSKHNIYFVLAYAAAAIVGLLYHIVLGALAVALTCHIAWRIVARCRAVVRFASIVQKFAKMKTVPRGTLWAVLHNKVGVASARAAFLKVFPGVSTATLWQRGARGGSADGKRV